MRARILVAVAFILAAGVALANPAIIITPAFITQALADARYLLLSGGTVTGQVTTSSAATTGANYTDAAGCTGAQHYFAPADGLKYAVCAKRTGSDYWAGIANFGATNSPAFVMTRGGLNAQIYMSPTNGFQIDYAGNVILHATNTAGIFSPVKTTSALTGTVTNCTDSAGAAACSAAPAGSVVIDAGATTVVVSTTAVTANSQVFVQEDPSLATKLGGITCNTVTGRTYTVTARTGGTSFTITASAAPATDRACLSYFIVN